MNNTWFKLESKLHATGRNDRDDNFPAIILNGIVMIVTIVINLGLFHYLPRFFHFLRIHKDSYWAKIAPFVLIVICSLVLFAVKRAFLKQYGIIEITFGLVSAWYAGAALLKSPDSMTSWITVTGVIYLLVRGLGNYRDARTPKRNA